MNSSSYFITPTIGLKYSGSIHTSDFIDSYLFTASDLLCDEAECTVEPKYMYFLYKDTIDEGLKQHFMSHQQLEEVLTPAEGLILFKLRIPQEYVSTVVTPFIDGKYSEIDRTYVDTHFPATSTKYAGNRAILYKSPEMRKYWEEKIGVDLPQDAEVWSKPDLTKETYFYDITLQPNQGFPEA